MWIVIKTWTDESGSAQDYWGPFPNREMAVMWESLNRNSYCEMTIAPLHIARRMISE